MSHPYKDLSARSFWKPSVADLHFNDIHDLWSPKFEISKSSKIVTYGSCFAQHIGKNLFNNGYAWRNYEQAPFGMQDSDCIKFNYGIFSARTGNIYTTSLLNQWCSWALKPDSVPKIDAWIRNNRYHDPFRPNIEPDGFISNEEVHHSRLAAIHAFRHALEDADIFVFTLGLTESWFDSDGFEYPMCPGVVAGTFNPNRHLFKNQSFDFISSNLQSAIDSIRNINNNIKFLITVSPVPLTATLSGNHILTASIESKSILRAVASQFFNSNGDVDYFPSYEIIVSHPYRSLGYDNNLRTVNQHGVSMVMRHFFKGLSHATMAEQVSNHNVVCEEELLSAFSKGI